MQDISSSILESEGPTINSILGFKWIQKEIDSRYVTTLIQKFGLNEVVARILSGRNIAIDEVENYLSPTLRNYLPDPFHLKDMDKAVDRIVKAIYNKENIVIYGDYDVDGATSSAVLKRFFDMVGANSKIYIPDRIIEGYGPNSETFLKLKSQGTDLIITVDCGTVAFEPLAIAKQNNLDVIVIDHHLSTEVIPEAVAVINPNRIDETSEFGYLAAVGVAFLLCIAVRTKLKIDDYFTDKTDPDLFSLLDLVALGTVCDVVPLKGINRAFVHQGLKIFSKRQNIGIAKLNSLSSITDKITPYHLGYIIGPRINAGGRIGKSDLGATLLSTYDTAIAEEIAQKLSELNNERKTIEQLVYDEANEMAEIENTKSSVIIVHSTNWNQGVIGIVASRLKEKFNKPTAVISITDGVGKGSCRSVKGIDFGSAITTAKMLNIISSGGGHAMAAGLTVEAHRIEELKEFLDKRFVSELNIIEDLNTRYYYASINCSSATPAFVKSIDILSPFGSGNSEPKFLFKNCYIVKCDIVAMNHLRLIIADDRIYSVSKTLRATIFRGTENKIGKFILENPRARFNIIGHLKVSTWQDIEKSELIISDIALA